MARITAVAVVLAQQDGTIVKGVVGRLQTSDGAALPPMVIISNEQGYDVFKQVPVPFDGELTLQAKDPAGTVYVRKVSIPAGAVNVTLRVGPSPSNPQDIHLDPCVPFV